MKCTRCGQEFDNTIAECNAEMYGSGNISACPHCGKAYYARRIIRINFEPIDDITLDTVKKSKYDDWGERILSDKQYEKKKNKKQCTEE